MSFHERLDIKISGQTWVESRFEELVASHEAELAAYRNQMSTTNRNSGKSRSKKSKTDKALPTVTPSTLTHQHQQHVLSHVSTH
jgi:hypothetical protein